LKEKRKKREIRTIDIAPLTARKLRAVIPCGLFWIIL